MERCDEMQIRNAIDAISVMRMTQIRLCVKRVSWKYTNEKQKFVRVVAEGHDSAAESRGHSLEAL